MITFEKDSTQLTSTVGELIEKLSNYPEDMAVAYTWEGQTLAVEHDKFYTLQENDFLKGPTLIMDAN